jgi:flagellin-specific chaperone FliS
MKLFNKTIDRQLFKQYSLGSDLSKQEVVVKIFNPTGAGNWFILNSDPQDPDYLWAIVDLGYGAEVGSVSRNDLETYRGRFGLGFERDLGFDPINAEELYQGLRNGEYYADGGQIEVVYERSVGSKKPIKLLLLNKGKEQKGYTFSGKDQVAVLENYNRNKQEDLERLWNLKGYEAKYAVGGEVKDIKGKILGTILKESKTKGFENKSDNNKILRLLKKSEDSKSYGVQIGKMIYSFDNINEAEEEFKLLQQGYKNNFADGGGIEEHKPYVFYFYYDGNEMTFNTLEKALKEAKQYGAMKVRDNLGGEYFLNYADGGEISSKLQVLFEKMKNSLSSKNFNYFDKLSNEVHEISDTKGLTEKEYNTWDSLREKQNELRMTAFLGKSKFADGGNIADFTDNQQMIMNQNVELEHHHEELEDILKDEMPVPAWVVAKMATATQSISDVTHYLDGEKELMKDEMEDEMEDQLEEEDDDDDDDEMEMEEIENKEVVEPIVVTAGDKTEITKNFTDDAWDNLRGFLKGYEGIDLRDDYTFDYKDEQFEVEPIINSDENGVSNAVFTIFDGDGEEVGEVAYSREGGKQKFTANSEFFSWNNAKFEDGGFMNNVYADGGYFDGAIPKTSSYMSTYADGGEVNHLFYDTFVSLKNGFDLYKINGNENDDVFIGNYKSLEEANKAGKELGLEKRPNYLRYAKGGSIDVEHWLTINKEFGKPKWQSQESKDLNGVFNEVVDVYNRMLDSYDEPKVTSQENKQIKELAEKFFKIKGFVTFNIIEGMANEIIKPRLKLVYYSKGGMVVTSVKDIPNFQERLKQGRITYRGLGMGKLANDFYKLAGTSGTRIKVDKKEYFITDEEFDMFSRDSDGKMIIKFEAPARKGYADGGFMNGVYEDGGFLDKYEVDRFKQVMNGKAIAKYIVRLQDSFGNKETYVFGIKLKDQFKGCELVPYEVLYGSWSDSGTPFALSNLQVKRLVPNSFSNIELDEQETEMLVNKLVNKNQAGVEKFLNSQFFYLNYNQTFKDVLRGHLALSIARVSSIEFEIVQKFADGGQVRSFDGIFGKEIIFKEEQVGKFTIGISSGFNNRRHVFIYEGEVGRYGGKGLPKDFNMSPQLSAEFADNFYSNLKRKVENNQDLTPFELIKEVKFLFADGGFMNDVYAKGGSVKKDWWQTVVNPNEDFHNYDNRKPIDWEVDDFKEWVVSNSDLDGNVDKEVLDVIKMPKSKLTVEYLNKNGSGKNNNEYYKEFGNWQSALYDIFTQMKKDYLFKKSRKYILKADIKTVTVKRKGKEVTYNASDVLNGAYVLAKGGDMTSKANYVGKNDVVEVELKDGSKVKPANGYWIKKGAEPIGAEPTPTTSGKSEPKVGQTYIRKDMRNNWKAETNVDNFNDYDWRVSTIKTYSGKLISSAQGGKTEATGSKGIVMFKYTMYEDPNYTLEVSQPSRLTEKVVTEQHEKALAKFKKFMETGMFKGGGKISNFDKLSAKVAKNYEGKPVKSQYQEEYGKYYSKEEAQEVGDKVAGKVKAMQPAKKEMGGGTKKATSGSEMLKQANILAKEIRKDGESWNDAKKRAFAQLKK